MDDRPLGEQGFTLIELLLAVGLSALMVGVVMGTYVAIRRGVAESLVRHEAEMEGGGLLRQLMWDLESADLGNPSTPDRLYFEGKVSGAPWQTARLSFVTARAGEGETGLDQIADLGRVTYRLEPFRGDETRFLLYRDLTPLMSQSPVKKELLSDRVASFRVVFEDRNHRQSRRWDSRAQRWLNRLPVLVRVEVAVLDQGGKRHTFRGQVHPMQDWME